jgi:16S rRNA (cytosine1402-N4)-methyltransferase
MTMRSLPTKTDEENSSALFSAFSVSPHSPELVGRLQMATDYVHTPVLLEQVLALFSRVRDGVVIDATLGGGGHASALLAERDGIRILGIDRDPAARIAATALLSAFGDRVHIVAGTFGELESVTANSQTFIDGAPIVGVLMDLGVSSPQLDVAERGFSFRTDAPLDMRMDPTSGPTAAEVLATIDAHELTRLLHRHGEGRFAGAIARRLVTVRPTTTGELVAAVSDAVPAPARRRGNVATRVFQALRVVVNDEENQLDLGLRAALAVTAPEGVVTVISYHSGEDRAVKVFFNDTAWGGCTCPREVDCTCGRRGHIRVYKPGAVLATASEVAENPRARSARLRAAFKVAS